MSRLCGFVRIPGLLPVLAAALLCAGLLFSQVSSSPGSGLVGTVKTADGKPLEGVAVSARAQDKTFTTSVYTDSNGQYFFPTLADGSYRIWAQAVGFEAGRAEQTISSGKRIERNFSLKPFKDFHKQLSATEWTDSMPSDTPEDRRMQRLVHYNCSSCHITGFVLAKRFDAAGWGMILDYMVDHETPPDGAARRLLQSYKEELVGYLARVRGPKAYPWKFKPHPRPAGEAAQVVVTEYDLSRGDQPGILMSHNGSDWSEGIPSKYEGDSAHDAVVDQDGNVWFTDNATPERTIGKLDPKTGRVTGYKLADKDGFAVRTHGAIVDQKGNIWFTNGTEGTLLKFDPKTEQFLRFPKPSSLTPGIGGMVKTDSKGNLWVTQPNGAFRLNPETGEYTEYKSPGKAGYPYGMTVDADDNAWYAEIAADRLCVVDSRTGEVTAVPLPPLDVEISQRDREIGQRSGAITNAAPLYQKGPRRLNADLRGDAVWVAEYWAGRVAKIDIHSKKITEYTVPHPNSHPYAIAVDKNHMVWISLMNSDRVARFNPFTEQFTEYPLPTLGTEARFIDVDDRTDPPTVWLPYARVNKLGRVEFRTDPAGPMAAKESRPPAAAK